MPELQVSLSDSANEFILGQVAAGVYRTPSEAVSALVEKAQKRAAEKLRAFIQEGLDSGPAIHATDEWLEQYRKELLARIPEDAAE